MITGEKKGSEPRRVLGEDIELSSDQPAVKRGSKILLCQFISKTYPWTCIALGGVNITTPLGGTAKDPMCDLDSRTTACEVIE